MGDRKCLRSTCYLHKDDRCCLDCTDKDKCGKVGKCDWDSDHLDLKNCSE
jgi:hypothetical protein